jgi:hypothetical protein
MSHFKQSKEVLIMSTVIEIIEYLNELKDKGKGDYTVVDGEYGIEINTQEMMLNDKDKELIM